MARLVDQLLVDQVVDIILARIASGEFGHSVFLPSAIALRQQLHVEVTLRTGEHKIVTPSKQTVIFALNYLLSCAKLLKQGNSYMVVSQQIRIPLFPKNFAEHLLGLGLEPVETNLIQPEIISATEELARIFSVEVGTPLVHRKRRQGSVLQPFRTAENWYPVDLAAGSILEAMQSDSTADVLEMIKEKHGVFVTHADDHWIARPCFPDEVKELLLPRFNWVVDLEHVLRSEDGSVVLYNRTIANANLCDFTISYDVDYWR
jgi:DNA-binding GntR family transcriptional regulator